ncbi:hypothetical protein ACLH0M_14665 [Aeromonas media]
MSSEFQWKKFQFITEVQTAFINNAINLSLEEDAKDHRHVFSATGTLTTMNDAFYAAERIPADMSAHEAACDFIGFFCDNLREENENVPRWCARY